MTEYFQYLMQYHDGRFAKDPRFRFFAMNTVLRHQAISSANVFVKNCAKEDMTVQKLQDKISNDPLYLRNIMAYSGKLRSTKPYWNKRCSELSAMVEQLGKPAIFFTLSAADYYWPDLCKVLSRDKDFAKLTLEDKRRLVHDNPVIVSHFIQFRVDVFIKHVVKPIFKVCNISPSLFLLLLCEGLCEQINKQI